MAYQVWDISTWAVMSQEARGLDPKDWVVPPTETAIDGQAHWWLYKPIKSASYRRFDDWSEKMSAELARLLDLPAARVELANGTSNGQSPVGWWALRWILGALLAALDGGVITSIHGVVEQRHGLL